MLPHFTQLLKDLKEKVPSIFPKPGLVDALIAIADYDCSGSSFCEVDLSSLSLSARAALVGSELYKSWMKKSLEERISKLQQAQKTPQELRPLLEPLAKLSDDSRVTFALTWCGPASYDQRLAYLLSDVGRFDLLKFWYPTAPELCLSTFVSEEPKFGHFTEKQYLAGLESLSKCSTASSFIKLQVVKSALDDWACFFFPMHASVRQNLANLGVTDGGRPILGHVLRLVQGHYFPGRFACGFYTSPCPSTRRSCSCLGMGFVSREF